MGRSQCSEFQQLESAMKWTGVVTVFAVVAFAITAMAFAQAPVGAWCAGSYGAEGINFGPYPSVQADAQVVGLLLGTQDQSVSTVPHYPTIDMTFNVVNAFIEKHMLNFIVRADGASTHF